MQLADRPVRAIVRAVSDAASRWSDADFPARVRVTGAIAERTGYSLPVVEYALDRLFFSVTSQHIEAVIADELGTLDALDGFAPRPGRPPAFARPVGKVCIISSRTTIGVALVPAIFALCAKCEVLVKDRDDRLAEAFFATLCDEFDEFATAARAQTWEGDRTPEPLREFDAVVAFGDDATLDAIGATLPARTRFIAYGSKASLGYVTREALANESDAARVADGAARDLVLYDTEGCLSLHGLFVERGGAVDPERFSELFARAVERANVEFPPSSQRSVAALRVAAVRDLAAFRSAGGRGTVYADAAATYCVVTGASIDEPPAFLPRTIAVRAVDSPADVATYVRQHRVPLEAVAVAGSRDDVVSEAIALGASRIARFGELQSPPLGAFHGGRPRIADFVEWIGDET